MANPQIENGYTPIANEILDQICKQNLNGSQFRIIMVVWRYTYGFSRKKHELSETFISKAIRSHKKQVSRELNQLIRLNIIKVERAATFTEPIIISFNKDYSKWLSNSRQYTNQLPPNGLEYTTPSGLVASTGSESVTQENNNKTKLKQDIEYQRIIDMYNDICISFSKIIKVSENRKKTIKTRLKNYTVDEFKKMFAMAEESEFLKGVNDRGWRANFDCYGGVFR